MSALVRPARPADFPAIGRLTVAAYRADGQLNAAADFYADRLADVVTRADQAELLVAVDPGTGDVLGAVAFCMAGSAYAELATDGEAEFRMLAVDPAAQGRGVGEALAMACLTRADEAGCSAVVICVRDFAMAAQRLYARLGFQRAPDLDWMPGPGIQLLGLRRALPLTS